MYSSSVWETLTSRTQGLCWPTEGASCHHSAAAKRKPSLPLPAFLGISAEKRWHLQRGQRWERRLSCRQTCWMSTDGLSANLLICGGCVGGMVLGTWTFDVAVTALRGALARWCCSGSTGLKVDPLPLVLHHEMDPPPCVPQQWALCRPLYRHSSTTLQAPSASVVLRTSSLFAYTGVQQLLQVFFVPTMAGDCQRSGSSVRGGPDTGVFFRAQNKGWVTTLA